MVEYTGETEPQGGGSIDAWEIAGRGAGSESDGAHRILLRQVRAPAQPV